MNKPTITSIQVLTKKGWRTVATVQEHTKISSLGLAAIMRDLGFIARVESKEGI
jgi:hypothetical protein